jgi:hypothetical protein
VRDQEDRAPGEVAADELLGEVGLPGERVDVVARLLREPEAEEVEGERGPVRNRGEQPAPVERARREPVQEQQRRVGALALEDVDRAVAEALGAPLRAPGADPLGQNFLGL